MDVSGRAIVERMNQLGEIKDYVMSCGIPASTISNWRTRDSSPKVSDIVKIAEYKNVSLYWLIFGKERDADIPADVLELAEDISRLPAEYREIIRHNVESYKALCLRQEKEGSRGIG